MKQETWKLDLETNFDFGRWVVGMYWRHWPGVFTIHFYFGPIGFYLDVTLQFFGTRSK